MLAGRLSAGLSALLLVAVVGCAAEAVPDERSVQAEQEAGSSAPFRILPDPALGSSNVSVVRPVGITVTGGKLTSVTLSSEDGQKVEGELSDDGARWLATEPLDYDAKYRWRGSATDAAGKSYPISGSFRTVDPEQLVTVSANVVDGGVYPDDLAITLTFSVPVEEPGVVEKALLISAEPTTRGKWEWSEDSRVAQWIVPKWKPGTTVQVSGKLYGVRFGPGDYGADDMHFGLRIADG